MRTRAYSPAMAIHHVGFLISWHSSIRLSLCLGGLMRFWISGEVFHDVSREYRLAASAVSESLNAGLGKIDYAIPVDSWDVIGILLPHSVPRFEEVRRYDPAR